MSAIRTFTTLALAGGLALAGAPRPAAACGGFFCMNQPMDQAGEKIVFSIDGQTVTAAIQIQFVGSSTEFSWVLPLPSEPENEGGMDIGSEELFTAVLQRTQPTFTVEWAQGSCNPWWGQRLDDFAGAGGGAEEGGPKGVEVLQVKEVGPYVATVVRSDDPGALSTWLTENGYDLPVTAEPLIAYYVEQDHVFLALKLQQDKGAGDIAPIVVKFQSDDGACIPLVLTQIAAQADMPVFAWILDSGRTVPKNFFHVEPNLAKVSWFDGGQNYTQLVTDAVNEAAGHGFVTDFAGPSSLMKDAVWWDGRFSGLEALKSVTDPAQFYQQLFSVGLPVNSQTQNLIKKHIPLPPDWSGTDQEFYSNLESHAAYLATIGFDPAAFVADIEEVIVEPVKAAQALLDSRPYLTRLFTTVSPEEMNRDPIFVVDETLPEVPVARVAQGVATCGPDGQTVESVTLTLPDGTKVVYAGSFPRYDSPPEVGAGSIEGGGKVADAADAAEIQAWSTTAGALQSVEPSMVEYQDQQLAIQSGEPLAPGDGGTGAPPATTGGGSSSGCTAAPAVAAPLALLLCALALARVRSRRE